MTQRDCLEIALAVVLLRVYLKSTRVIIRTGQDILKRILNSKDSCRRLVRCRLQLSEFRIQHYRPQRHETSSRRRAIAFTDSRWRRHTTWWLWALLAVDAERDRTSILLTNTNSNEIAPVEVHDKASVDIPPTLDDLIAEQSSDGYW